MINFNLVRLFSGLTFLLEPQKPPRPVDMSQVSQRVTGGAKYNVLIQWSLPRDVASDLPIKGKSESTKHMALAEWLVHWAPKLASRVRCSTRSSP